MINIKVYESIDIGDFEFWGGGKVTADMLTHTEFKIIAKYLLASYALVGIEKTELNDYFWFERDRIAQFLGYKDFAELFEERKDL